MMTSLCALVKISIDRNSRNGAKIKSFCIVHGGWLTRADDGKPNNKERIKK